MSGPATITLQVSDELLERLATSLAPLLRPDYGVSYSVGDDGGSPWMTVRDAAAYLACSRHALYRLTAAKAIPYRKRQAGQGLLFNRDELDRWIEHSYSREGVVI